MTVPPLVVVLEDVEVLPEEVPEELPEVPPPVGGGSPPPGPSAYIGMAAKSRTEVSKSNCQSFFIRNLGRASFSNLPEMTLSCYFDAQSP